MNGTVFLTPEAKDDLVEIYLYVAEHDAIAKADALLNKIEAQCLSLSNNPERGHVVPELRRIHLTGFREIHFEPYRIVYQVLDDAVYVHAVLDGRRELQEVLGRRFFR